MTELEKVKKTADFLRSKFTEIPDVAVILGSGLGPFAEVLEDSIKIPYSQIPYFEQPSVAGHEGQLVLGKLAGRLVLAQQGRWHFYEGHSMDSVVFPTRVFAALGIKTLLITNAAGGVNKAFKAGDLMLIQDHLNLIGTNPLRGHEAPLFGKQFPDMSSVYDLRLQKLIKRLARSQKLKLREGVYAALSGPTYETPAEVRMLRKLGADAVGMSTVPEAVAANQLSMTIAGISCITNAAAGILKQPLDHSEVKETANQSMKKFIKLLTAVIQNL